MVKVRGETDGEGLSLASLVPSSGRSGAAVGFEYLMWLEQERKLAPRTMRLNACAILVARSSLLPLPRNASADSTL